MSQFPQSEREPSPTAPAAGSAAAAMPDHCPYHLEFRDGFVPCSTFGPVVAEMFDSTFRPLQPVRTCRHMVAGQVEGEPGRFYPRCGLGALQDRRRWLTAVTPERQRTFARLEAGLAAACVGQRSAVFDSKRRLLRDRDSAAARDLELAGRALVDAATRFFAAHAAEFESIGMPPSRLPETFEVWTGAWLHGREFEPPRITPSALQAFGPIGQALLTSALPADLEGSGEVVYSDAVLSVVLVQEASTVSIAGVVDATNADRVRESVEAIAAQAPEDLHLDLAGLTFCDLAGLGAIIRSSETLVGPRRLIVHGLPAYLWRAMSIIGWVSLPRIVLVGAAPEAAEAGAGLEAEASS